MAFVNFDKIPFAYCLQSNYTAIKNDRQAFEKWAKGEISINDCFVCFKYNNKIRSAKVDLKKFELWLNSLGYRRA